MAEAYCVPCWLWGLSGRNTALQHSQILFPYMLSADLQNRPPESLLETERPPGVLQNLPAAPQARGPRRTHWAAQCSRRVSGPLLWFTLSQPRDFGRTDSSSKLWPLRLWNIKMELLCRSCIIMIMWEALLRSYKQSWGAFVLNSIKYVETSTGFFLYILFESEVGTYTNILFWNTFELAWLHGRSNYVF